MEPGRLLLYITMTQIAMSEGIRHSPSELYERNTPVSYLQETTHLNFHLIRNDAVIRNRMTNEELTNKSLLIHQFYLNYYRTTLEYRVFWFVANNFMFVTSILGLISNPLSIYV